MTKRKASEREDLQASPDLNVKLLRTEANVEAAVESESTSGANFPVSTASREHAMKDVDNSKDVVSIICYSFGNIERNADSLQTLDENSIEKHQAKDTATKAEVLDSKNAAAELTFDFGNTPQDIRDLIYDRMVYNFAPFVSGAKSKYTGLHFASQEVYNGLLAVRRRNWRAYLIELEKKLPVTQH